MKVRDIAIKDIYCIAPTANLNSAAAMMKRHGIGAIPVCLGDHLIGMLTDRDIVISCVAAGMNPASCRVDEFMTSDPISIIPDTDVEEAARIMGREQVRRLPVVEGDRLVGVLSLGDLAASLLSNDNLVAETLRKISKPTHAVVPC